MKTLGIITTTYNRGYCIHQVYESLKRQDSSDFMWLVIDDGSTDNTKELITEYINEGLIEIEYIYQKNKGMTGARNTAYNHIQTEINTIIDSDDWLADNIVGKIIDFWNKNKHSDLAGIIGYNSSPDGKLISRKFPEGITKTTIAELSGKYKIRGDVKLIYRSDLTLLYPYPEFAGEKFFPASYKFRLLDLDYKMVFFSEIVCIVDYGENSRSFHKIEHYKNSPNAFAFYRNKMIEISRNRTYIIKQTIHYIACSMFAKNKKFIRESSKISYTVLCLPIGMLFYCYLKHTQRKSFRTLNK
jgi:glycosyltransferase involved in cell wall biosynthesis